jgi:hypothetical protein
VVLALNSAAIVYTHFDCAADAIHAPIGNGSQVHRHSTSRLSHLLLLMLCDSSIFSHPYCIIFFQSFEIFLVNCRLRIRTRFMSNDGLSCVSRRPLVVPHWFQSSFGRYSFQFAVGPGRNQNPPRLPAHVLRGLFSNFQLSPEWRTPESPVVSLFGALFALTTQVGMHGSTRIHSPVAYCRGLGRPL